MSEEAGVLLVAMNILDYMRRFPDAADTKEHITNWWLNEGDIEQEAGLVSCALQMLETSDYIERVELPDNRVVYRLKPPL